MTATSVEIGVVGKNLPFRQLKVEEIEAYLAKAKDFDPEGGM